MPQSSKKKQMQSEPFDPHSLTLEEKEAAYRMGAQLLRSLSKELSSSEAKAEK